MTNYAHYCKRSLACILNARHRRHALLKSSLNTGGFELTRLQESFTGLPTVSERFASSAAFQYHQPVPSLAELISYIQQKTCSASDPTCYARVATLSSADYLDIDYDAISQSLVLSIFRHVSPDSGTWDETLQKVAGSANIEVGVLANEKPTEPEHLSLGGFLTVIGEDTKPRTSPLPRLPHIS